MTPTEPVVQIRGLRKNFGDRAVIDGVDLSVARGERVALMGPSGSGKSTLLNLVGGIDRGDGGSLTVDGVDLQAATPDALAALRRERIGTVFQFFHLLPTLSARENVEFPLQLLGLPRAERIARVDQLITDVRLSARADAFPDELSGGEMQRVAIARALATQPRLILADEPTGNLDSATGEAILDLLELLTTRYDTALLLVTHSDAATRICHRVVHMIDGRIATP
jgi:ABC-type lipoprotein export system ATPase subunit